MTGRVVSKRIFGGIGFITVESEDTTTQYVSDKQELISQLKQLKLGTLLKIFSEETNERGKAIIKSLEIDLVPVGNFLKHDKIVEKEVRYKQRALAFATNIDERRILIDRSKIVKSVRASLDNFYDVETPVLQEHYGGAYAKPFITHSNYNDKRYYLRICHEFFLKKAVIAGLNRVYHIGPVFRNEDLDATHSFEYCALEAYERGGDYTTMIALTEKIVANAGASVGIATIGTQNLSQPWRRISYEEIIQKINPETTAVRQRLDLVEKYLKAQYANDCVHLVEIPAEIMPLAKDNGNGLALYADSYIQGVEIATMYSEENDVTKLRTKWQKNLNLNYEEQSLVNEDFIKDLEIGMPTCGGLGIGIDRLVRAILQKHSIRDAQAFPLI